MSTFSDPWWINKLLFHDLQGGEPAGQADRRGRRPPEGLLPLQAAQIQVSLSVQDPDPHGSAFNLPHGSESRREKLEKEKKMNGNC